MEGPVDTIATICYTALALGGILIGVALAGIVDAWRAGRRWDA
jgi:hypothetical protein